MPLITTAVMCPFCGKCFADTKTEAWHLTIAHKEVDVKIENVVRTFRVSAEPDDNVGVKCVCNFSDHCSFDFYLHAFEMHMAKAGGMAKHLEAVGWQILLDRVAGDDYDSIDIGKIESFRRQR